jgi:hypothetical protein
MKRLLVAVLLLSSVSLNAQSPDPDYQRVLVPVFNFGGGAGGSAWFSSFDMVSTTGAFDLARPVLKDTAACDFFCPCETKARVEPEKSETLCPQFEHPYGLLLWVPRNVNRRDVHTYLRVHDTSRDAERAGTQIPVIWEEDLFGSTMMLLDVKTEPRFRSTLRLYDAYQFPTEFSLRFYDMAEFRKGNLELLAEARVSVDVAESSNPRFSLRPAELTIGSIVARWPELAKAESVAIEVIGSHAIVSPPQYEYRFYAFASITNNTTHEVTIVSPR